MDRLRIEADRYEQIGANPDKEGVNFALVLPDAQRVELCFVDLGGAQISY